MLDTAADTPGALRACAYPPFWRIAAATLVAVSRASLPVLLVAGGLAQQPIPLFAWLRLLGASALLPAAAAWLIERAWMANVQVCDARLLLRRHDLQLAIPCNAIERVAPWTVPLPGPGLSLGMRSGRRLRYGLQAADLAPLLGALAGGGVEPARSAMRHTNVIYAHARARVRRRWYHPLGKFGVFALLPAAVMFNAQQHIAYGALFGQYYLEGLGPYLKTFSIYWGLASIYLLLYASAWRALAEAGAWLAAWIVPQHAAGARRVAEIACRILYYCGVPVMVAVPFLR